MVKLLKSFYDTILFDTKFKDVGIKQVDYKTDQSERILKESFTRAL